MSHSAKTVKRAKTAKLAKPKTTAKKTARLTATVHKARVTKPRTAKARAVAKRPSTTSGSSTRPATTTHHRLTARATRTLEHARKAAAAHKKQAYTPYVTTHEPAKRAEHKTAARHVLTSAKAITRHVRAVPKAAHGVKSAHRPHNGVAHHEQYRK